MSAFWSSCRGRAGAGCALALALACAPPTGRLEVAVRDAASGEITPARVELLDAEGNAQVPAGAIRMTLQCATAPPPEWAQAWVESTALDNPHTGTRQFYVDEAFAIDLPPGRYRLRAFKGIERRVAAAEAVVTDGGLERVELALERWADLPAEHWFGADDHIHVTRRTPDDDRRISRWMQGEDLHVANLLQMGTQAQVSVTPQRDYGDAGAFEEGGHWLFAGQEHPRTHFLGHTITLGAGALIDRRDTYIVYEDTFRAGRAEGGVTGFAHFGRGPAERGLAIEAPRGLVDFMEVLQFEWAHYDVWYRLLDMGIPIAPTAGTDFPCGPWSVPGRERFYTRVEGPLSRESWLAGIRAGRTFVTNGPFVELAVDGVGIGGERALDAPGAVEIEGRVRWDPERDDVRHVELLRGGEVVPVLLESVGPGERRFSLRHDVEGPAWFALRVTGEKVGELPLAPMELPDWVVALGRRIANGADITGREAWAATRPPRPTAAHTAPIWVSVGGAWPRDEALGRSWTRQLDDVEARLAEDRIDGETLWDWVPYSDGVSAEHLRRNRAALLRAIGEARAAWERRLSDGGTGRL